MTASILQWPGRFIAVADADEDVRADEEKDSSSEKEEEEDDEKTRKCAFR